MLLYHGSRGGLVGDIHVSDRVTTDFGQGFYMGTVPRQAKTLVAHDSTPYFYELDVPIESWEKDKILMLDDKDWSFFVLYNRGWLKDAKGTSLYHRMEALGKGKDFIIGPIADDNTSDVLRDFARNYITYPAMEAAITRADYGLQYVAKTPEACQSISILSERYIGRNEKQQLCRLADQNREIGDKIADQAYAEYRREGLYLDEIIQNAFEQDIKKGAANYGRKNNQRNLR